MSDVSTAVISKGVDAPPRSAVIAEGAATPSLRIRGHVPVLDGLRGLAILLVLLVHFTPQGPSSSFIGRAVKALSSVGGTGVDLFFVLSGFLITGILLDAKGTPRFFRNFYARRTLRIFPLYYGVLFVCFVLVPFVHPFGPAEHAVAHRQAWLWLYGTNIREGMVGADYPFHGGWIAMDHFWSLAIEEHFYLVWPLLVFLLSRRVMVGVCGAFIAVALGLRYWLYAADVQSMAFFHWTPCRMDELAMGGLLAILARGDGEGRWLGRAALIVAPASLLALALTWKTELRECVYGSTLLALLFASLLVLTLTARTRTPLRWAFDNAAMRWAGKYSYAAYVLHPLLLGAILGEAGYQRLGRVLHSQALGVFAYLMLATAITLGAAWLSWHVYEKHFLKLKRFFEYTCRGAPRPTR
jgi:peptidoglycan/LPS O-acetylase OafA/YrhL